MNRVKKSNDQNMDRIDRNGQEAVLEKLSQNSLIHSIDNIQVTINVERLVSNAIISLLKMKIMVTNKI